ncbi:hypothetical protein HGM15179_004579 [Zosterops borbonicus]|uniref:Uncharacterized protein n=1 Tax=Zosterops borbonicus TaxID=364589 RepID=A0A8K1LQY3_9PASS|nr:hypothetical protein HGM15179_004579 [Zosterops borbonicus]
MSMTSLQTPNNQDLDLIIHQKEGWSELRKENESLEAEYYFEVRKGDKTGKKLESRGARRTGNLCPYNKISTFKLLFGTIFELREPLGDGQALSGDNELEKAISRTALTLDRTSFIVIEFQFDFRLALTVLLWMVEYSEYKCLFQHVELQRVPSTGWRMSVEMRGSVVGLQLKKDYEVPQKSNAALCTCIHCGCYSFLDNCIIYLEIISKISQSVGIQHGDDQ